MPPLQSARFHRAKQTLSGRAGFARMQLPVFFRLQLVSCIQQKQIHVTGTGTAKEAENLLSFFMLLVY